MKRRDIDRRVVRDRVFAVVLAVVSVGLVLGPLPRSGAQAEPAIELRSSWYDGLATQLEDVWEPAMRLQTKSSVEVDNTIAVGDAFARRFLYQGQRDFVVTGSPLPEAELQALPAGTSFVSLPFSVSSLVLAMRQPAQVNAWVSETRGPPDEDGEPTVIRTPYEGPLRVQASLITDAIQLGIEVVRDPRFRADNDNVRLSSGGGFTWLIARSDPSSLNVQLQRFLSTNDTARWNQMLALYGHGPDFVSESFPINEASTRSLDGSMMASLADVRTPREGLATSGTIGLTTLARLKAAQARFPGAGFRPLTLKNAAGTWVTPSIDSITAGINGGLATTPAGLAFTDNAAMTNPALRNAYPLTWLNYLHAPSKGLSIDKTNALASFIRYAVTDGQSAHDVAGDPRLPAPLVGIALAQANALVESNCSAAKGVVTKRNDPGPFVPAGTLTGVTEMSWCSPAPPPAPTTTEPSTTTTTTTTTPPPVSLPVTLPPATAARVAPPAVTSPRPTAPPATSAPTTVPSTTTPAPTTTVATQVAGATEQRTAADAVPVDLPYGTPSNEPPPFNRLTTMAVGGGGLYAALRRWFRRSVE